MTAFVLVHGAFRGGWSFDPVRVELEERGHLAFAPTLTGMEGRNERRVDGRAPITLGDWVVDIARVLDVEDLTDVVLVGHSQGGIVVSAVAEQHPQRLARLVYLDAPVARPGERAVDLWGSPADPRSLPAADVWLDPQPCGDDSGLSEELRQWIDARLCATPFGPSIDVIIGREPEVDARYVFCSRTPETFPSAATRARFDSESVGYRVVDGPHDVALSDPTLVADLLIELSR